MQTGIFPENTASLIAQEMRDQDGRNTRAPRVSERQVARCAADGMSKHQRRDLEANCNLRSYLQVRNTQGEELNGIGDFCESITSAIPTFDHACCCVYDCIGNGAVLASTEGDRGLFSSADRFIADIRVEHAEQSGVVE